MIPFLASIPSPSRNVIEVGPLTIHFYGIMIAIGVIVAVIVTRRRYERFGGSGETVERASIWAVVVGFLGARLAYVSTHTGDFLDRPWAMLYIWEGGLALYGGLVAGTIAAVIVLRRSRGDVFAFGDAVAVGLPLAQVIGRLGNYFNQELFGTPSTLPWAVEIDANIAAAAGYPGFETFHPTFLYEALWNVFVTVGVILLLERRGKLFKGSSFALYMILYGAGRFLMELMRTDTTFRFVGLSRNGWVSVGAVLVGAVLFWWMQQRREVRTLVGPPVFIAPGAETVPAMPDPGEPGASDEVANNGDADATTTDGKPEAPPPS
ncbi:MAG: prolipoprotein diacylglyceryl transferase [Acidimicrobiia bacterium]|jgi:prolipoprotein diacylglyceryl transferase